jgi:hypothetical protein
VEWESRNNYPFNRADPSLKSFLFTLQNPHNVAAGRFALKAEKKDEAIYCHSDCGPHLWDIGVFDHCNANRNSYTYQFGICYANDTGLDGQTFFTGSKHFQVKEIEVFELTN